MKVSRIKRKSVSSKDKIKSSVSKNSLSSFTTSSRSSLMSSKGISPSNPTSGLSLKLDQTETHITVRYSLSPSKSPILDSIVQPKEYTSLISFQSIDNQSTQCHPYEIKDEIRLKKYISRSKNIDLTPGIFSKKQIISESSLKKSLKSQSNPFGQDDSTALISKTPSPIYSRNQRCSFLSKNFKIDKKLLPSQLASNFKELEKSTHSEMYPKGQPIRIVRTNN